ncbi:MAG: hypothetical protein GY751_08250 [Bacteroidetes bacterium]|nr:hypothetical protein [Bacteroidota bacterium]
MQIKYKNHSLNKGVQAFRRSGVQAFRRSGVQAFRRSGVQVCRFAIYRCQA